MPKLIKFSSAKAIQQLRKLTRLEPKNKTHSIEEGIQARIKDPCWFLGRQWQMGEFKAQNGGRPVRTEISVSKLPLNKIVRGSSETQFDINAPLEMMAERENISEEKNEVKVEGWNPQCLEYNFKIKNGKTELIAEEYNGNQLDWYDFKLSNNVNISGPEEDISIFPKNLRYKGMPNSRWWTFEDHLIDVGNIKRPYLNYLTMILMEFALLYSNDWFYIPINYDIGNLRKITRFNVMDSFGIVTDVKPVVDATKERKGWEIFTLSKVQDGSSNDHISDGSLFYIPNNLDDGGLESTPIEEVSLLRDELANLVWGVEHKYENAEGDIIDRHDEELEKKQKMLEEGEEKEILVYYWDKKNEKLVKEDEITEEDKFGLDFVGPLAKYELMSYVPPYWIPYVPRQIVKSDILKKGQIILRRGRTKVDSPDITQYKGVFLGESKYIFEEEVPRTGIFLKRVWQLARDTNGDFYLWCGRKKSQDMKRKSSGLRFDYLKSTE